MDQFVRFFYLRPKDVGIQSLDFNDIVDIMKPTSKISNGPKEFADAMYDIFETNTKIQNGLGSSRPLDH